MTGLSKACVIILKTGLVIGTVLEHTFRIGTIYEDSPEIFVSLEKRGIFKHGMHALSFAITGDFEDVDNKPNLFFIVNKTGVLHLIFNHDNISTCFGLSDILFQPYGKGFNILPGKFNVGWNNESMTIEFQHLNDLATNSHIVTTSLFEAHQGSYVFDVEDVWVGSEGFVDWMFYTDGETRGSNTDSKTLLVRTCKQYSLSGNGFPVSLLEYVEIETNFYPSATITATVFDNQLSGGALDISIYFYVNEYCELDIQCYHDESKLDSELSHESECNKKAFKISISSNSDFIDICQVVKVHETTFMLSKVCNNTRKSEIIDLRFSSMQTLPSLWTVRGVEKESNLIVADVFKNSTTKSHTVVDSTIEATVNLLTGAQTCCKCPLNATKIEEIINEIKVNRRNTSRYFRRLNCASDSRKSSKAIGLVAATFLSSVVIIVFVMDISNIQLIIRRIQQIIS